MTFASDALTAVEATLLKASGSADVTVSFGDFNLSFETRRELMAFRESLLMEVAEEMRLTEGRPIMRSVPVRMARL